MSFYYNLSIRYKLLLSFLTIMVMAVLFGLYLLLSVSSLRNSFTTLSENTQAFDNFLNLELQNRNLGIAVRNFILTKDPSYEAKYDAASLAFDAQIADLKKQESDSAKDEAEITSIKNNSDQIKGIELLVLARVREGNLQAAQSLFDTTYYDQQSNINATIVSLVSSESKAVQDLILQNSALALRLQSVTIAVLIGIIIAILFISFFVSNSLSRAIGALSKTAQAIADGSLGLEAEVSSGDEIGRLAGTFNAMTAKLRDLYTNMEKKVQDRTQELDQKMEELGRMNKLMIDRELKMIELKKEVEELKKSTK